MKVYKLTWYDSGKEDDNLCKEKFFVDEESARNFIPELERYSKHIQAAIPWRLAAIDVEGITKVEVADEW
jgi:hypothetical protein